MSLNQTENQQLSKDDLDRVNVYLNSPLHQVARKPFRPINFVFLTCGSVTGLFLLAWIVVKASGIEL